VLLSILREPVVSFDGWRFRALGCRRAFVQLLDEAAVRGVPVLAFGVPLWTGGAIASTCHAVASLGAFKGANRRPETRAGRALCRAIAALLLYR
jgi:hypothetical protein